MKKLILFICICFTLACKKESTEDIAGQSFVLRAATISPAMMVNGKAETNYMTMNGVGSCLNSNYTITFKKDGTYQITSTGALCDMVANLDNQKWTIDGDQVTLTHPFGAPIVATLKGDQLVYTLALPNGGINYNIVYKFEAK